MRRPASGIATGDLMAMTRAQHTYLAAMERNGDSCFAVNDLILPERVLEPAETACDVAMGGLSSDTFPLVIRHLVGGGAPPL